MTLRPYQTGDLTAIADLFYQSVHTLCRGDYNQRTARTPGRRDTSTKRHWDASFRARHTLVAEENGALLGFADMGGGRLSGTVSTSHPAHTGKGVATALVNALEAACAPPLGSQRTLRRPPALLRTARLRWLPREKEQQVVRRGAVLTNFVMKKTP